MTEGMAKPKAKGTSRASKPLKSTTKSKSPPKAGTKAKPGASEAKPLKLLAGGNPRIAKADGDAPVLAGMRSRERATEKPSSRLIDQEDWREETLTRMRALILAADPEMIEERKWKKPSNGMVGVPVWSHDGIVCTGETYKKAVKLTFAKGASLKDPAGLFNSSLEGNTRRAIDIHEDEEIDAEALKALIGEAVALNTSSAG
jgi:hypothetical protein